MLEHISLALPWAAQLNEGVCLLPQCIHFDLSMMAHQRHILVAASLAAQVALPGRERPQSSWGGWWVQGSLSICLSFVPYPWLAKMVHTKRDTAVRAEYCALMHERGAVLLVS